MKSLAIVAALMLVLVPSHGQAHGEGSAQALQPFLSNGHIVAPGTYASTHVHSRYRMQTWLMVRHGSDWDIVATTECPNTGAGNTQAFCNASTGSYDCRRDYMTGTEGRSWGQEVGWHRYRNDYTSPILQETC